MVEIPDQLDRLPADDTELGERLDRIGDTPHGNGLYLNAAGSAAALYVSLLPDQDRTAFLERLEAWIGSKAPALFELRLTGPVVAEGTLGRAVLRDLVRLVPFVVAAIAVLLLVALGSVGALLVILAEVVVVLACTIGAMGWTGSPLTIVTTILPVLLLVMAVTDEIHLLDRFQCRLEEGNGSSAAMGAALSDVALPIALTSLTTAASLLSFTLTSVVPLRHFGVFAAAGVLLAMFLTFTLTPALVRILPERAFRCRFRRRRQGSGTLARALGGRSALAAALLLVVLAPGLLRLEARDSWVENFEPDSTLVQATNAYDEAFWGSYRYDVVLSAEELAFFQFPEGLGVVERTVDELGRAPHARGVISHLDAYEVHATVDGEDLPVSGLPLETVRRFSGNLMKIGSRIDLGHYLSPDGRRCRIRLLVPRADFQRTAELEAHLEQRLPEILAGSGVRWHRSGDLAAAQATVGAVVSNMVRSSAWTLVGVTLLLALALRSLAVALVCIVPLLAGVTVLLCVMGWLGVPLGIATGMFTAVTIGVGVDFGLHLFHAYMTARNDGESHQAGLATMLRRAGRPILWNTVVLAAGLSVLGASTLPPNRRLGLLLAGAIVLCCALSLLILPVLFRTLVRDRIGTVAAPPA